MLHQSGVMFEFDSKKLNQKYNALKFGLNKQFDDGLCYLGQLAYGGLWHLRMDRMPYVSISDSVESSDPPPGQTSTWKAVSPKTVQ